MIYLLPMSSVFLRQLLIAALVLSCISIISHQVEAQSSDSELILIVEADTFVPSSYLGAAPVTAGARARIVAIGGDRFADYTWQINGRTIPAYSGIGQTVLTMEISDRPIDIKVIATNNQTQQIGQVKINPLPIDLVLYQNHPTRGPLYQNALLDTIRTTATAFDMIAVPYGATGNDLTVSWEINQAPTSRSQFVSFSQSQNSGIGDISAEYNGNIFNQDRVNLRIIFPQS